MAEWQRCSVKCIKWSSRLDQRYINVNNPAFTHHGRNELLVEGLSACSPSPCAGRKHNYFSTSPQCEGCLSSVSQWDSLLNDLMCSLFYPVLIHLYSFSWFTVCSLTLKKNNFWLFKFYDPGGMRYTRVYWRGLDDGRENADKYSFNCNNIFNLTRKK